MQVSPQVCNSRGLLSTHFHLSEGAIPSLHLFCHCLSQELSLLQPLLVPAPPPLTFGTAVLTHSRCQPILGREALLLRTKLLIQKILFTPLFYTQPGHRAEHAKYSRRAAKINSNSTELFAGMLYRANNNSPERAAFICEVNTDGILPK